MADALEKPVNDAHILIAGTGAMACLFAARLAQAGAQISMLGAWQDGLHALQQQGVRLVEANGQERAYPVHATNDPLACQGARQCLVLVKAWQTVRVAEQLSTCLAEDGLALSLQNGAGNVERLAQSLGIDRVALGVTTVGATLLGPGQVRMAGEGVISLSAQAASTPLSEWLSAAAFPVKTVPDARALLWGKLVINAAINPLTALLKVTNGELLSYPSARALLQEAAREAAAVAAAQGIRLPYTDPVAIVEEIAQRTGSNHSSMLQDVLRGAPTEIDAICGAIVQAGEQAGIPTPTNHTLWLLVKAIENRKQP